MTPEQFLEYIGSAANYRDKGKARLNRAAANYQVYVKAYREQSLRKLVGMVTLNHTYACAIWKATEDRDAGRPMVQIPELL